MTVKTKPNSASIGNNPTIGWASNGKRININPHTRIISIKQYEKNITIQYGKTKLTAIYSQERRGNDKIIYLIEGDSVKDVGVWIESKKKEIAKKLDKAIFKFARDNNILIPLSTPIWTRYEDFIKGEEYIDKLPKDLIVHGRAFKKVYGKGIEFTKYKNEEPVEHLNNYIENQALSKHSPEIAKSLTDINSKVDRVLIDFISAMAIRNKADKELSINLRTHTSVLKKIDKSFKRFNTLLSQKKLKEWV